MKLWQFVLNIGAHLVFLSSFGVIYRARFQQKPIWPTRAAPVVATPARLCGVYPELRGDGQLSCRLKLPFLQFYPADYMRDTRALSLAAKGGWVDILCMLHSSPTRGTMTLPEAGWARIMGANATECSEVLNELSVLGISDMKRESNGDVTLSSRRMLRELISKEQTRLRVRRLREKSDGNGDVTPMYENVTGKKSETRNQKPEIDKGGSTPPAQREAAPEVPESPAVCVFPTTGKEPHWTLREAKLAEYVSTFPGFDVRAESLRARQWCLDNPQRRKTAGGMPRFLYSWFERAQNRGGQTQLPSTSNRRGTGVLDPKFNQF